MAMPVLRSTLQLLALTFSSRLMLCQLFKLDDLGMRPVNYAALPQNMRPA